MTLSMIRVSYDNISPEITSNQTQEVAECIGYLTHKVQLKLLGLPTEIPGLLTANQQYHRYWDPFEVPCPSLGVSHN